MRVVGSTFHLIRFRLNFNIYFWTLNFGWLIKCLFMAGMRGPVSHYVPLETVWKKIGEHYGFNV